MSSLSSEAAKWFENSRQSGVWHGVGGALACARWTIVRVTLCHLLAPESVNEKVTSGSPPVPLEKFCSGLVMSVPLSDGLSLSTYQRFGFGPFVFPVSARTRIVPGLTLTARVPGGRP